LATEVALAVAAAYLVADAVAPKAGLKLHYVAYSSFALVLKGLECRQIHRHRFAAVPCPSVTDVVAYQSEAAAAAYPSEAAAACPSVADAVAYPSGAAAAAYPSGVVAVAAAYSSEVVGPKVEPERRYERLAEYSTVVESVQETWECQKGFRLVFAPFQMTSDPEVAASCQGASVLEVAA